MRSTGSEANTVYRHELASSGLLFVAGVWVFLIAALLAFLFSAVVSQIIYLLRYHGIMAVAACIGLVALLPANFVIRRYRLQIATLRRILLIAFGYALIPMVFFSLSLLFSLIEEHRIPWEALYVFFIVVAPILLAVLVWYGYQFVHGPIAIIENGQCRRCGYNLRGTVSGVCPECGNRTAA